MVLRESLADAPPPTADPEDTACLLHQAAWLLKVNEDAGHF
jgi:hypothetical protein